MSPRWNVMTCDGLRSFTIGSHRGIDLSTICVAQIVFGLTDERSDPLRSRRCARAGTIYASELIDFFRCGGRIIWYPQARSTHDSRSDFSWIDPARWKRTLSPIGPAMAVSFRPTGPSGVLNMVAQNCVRRERLLVHPFENLL